MNTLWAHTAGKPNGEWHDLRRHLLDVAATAERSAAKFGVGASGWALGLSHHGAKADSRFQRYLRQPTPPPCGFVPARPSGRPTVGEHSEG
ncbi:MAG: hypothetical protein KIS66_02475 [Fimbriimonadaceae bacterium]|nr:hypothetical protein [Fimbriimonadaceae bacterium]